MITDAERLLVARRRRGIPGWKLAGLADIDPTTYSKIEHGQRDATPDQRAALARALGVEQETIWQRGAR